MSARMMRWQVPVDDQDHGVPAHGPVVACGTTEGLWTTGPAHWVEFWTVDEERPPSDPADDRVFRVFGTGQPIPDGYVWRGTADRYRALVWHLFERATDPAPATVRLDITALDDDELIRAIRRAIRRHGGGDAGKVLA